MANKWLEALKEEESEHNTAAALRVEQNPAWVRPDKNPNTPNNSPSKTSKTIPKGSDSSENGQDPPSKTSKTPSEAEQLGLAATWSMVFGYLSLHDPTTGEWHDLPTSEAPGWARWEAGKRKQLYKGGNYKAYRLTSQEMKEVWRAEHQPDDEGIVEDHPIEEGA